MPLWRLIIHDWSKFLPSEWGAYVRRFGAGRAGKFNNTADPMDFHMAWTHHWHYQPHHWEHWLRLDRSGCVQAMEMPEQFVREMVADWMGAGRAYVGHWDIREWYAKHKRLIIITPDTRAQVERLIATTVLP